MNYTIFIIKEGNAGSNHYVTAREYEDFRVRLNAATYTQALKIKAEVTAKVASNLMPDEALQDVGVFNTRRLGFIIQVRLLVWTKMVMGFAV